MKLVRQAAIETCRRVAIPKEVRWNVITFSKLMPYLLLMLGFPLSHTGERVFSFVHDLWAITILRSWRILFFYGVWATGVCLIHRYVWNVALQSTLLTV